MSTAGWRVPINIKLLVILAVPVLGYLVIAATAVAQAQQSANEIRDQASVVKTAVGPISLTTSLIDERAITGLESLGLDDELTLRIGSSAEARRATDDQLEALQTLIADNDEARDVYKPAVEELANALPSLRADLDASASEDETLLTRYDEFIVQLMDANANAVDRVEDAEFWQGAMLSELATRQKNTRSVLINALIPVSLNGQGLTDPEQSIEIGRVLGAYQSRDAAIRELATGPYARAGSVLVEALEAGDLADLAQRTLDSGTLDSAELFDVASYQGGFVYDLPSGDYVHDSFRASVVEILEAKAADRTAAASRGLRIYTIAGTLGLVVTAGIAWTVSRSIVRPLRSLTEQAIDAATNRLPQNVHEILEAPLGEDVDWPELEPISVTTNDEVADVANALNTMQQSALDLAVEEAVLWRLVTDSLVTLGQRNQGLLTRQLDFITDLERDETDPDVLGNLFYLDHLAVRMRRNAESLLVLAGIDPPRKWLGPTPVGDIIRAAFGEAEQYKRVRTGEVEPATISGNATAELAHLLAELLENALVFSPARATVDVEGHHGRPGHGPGESYTITIKDSGQGMSAGEIEQANRRLAGLESYTIAPSKYMGHYVTGKLAARHGITVQLHANFPAKGITATIDVPSHLLSPEAAYDPPADLPPMHLASSGPGEGDDEDEDDLPITPPIGSPATEPAPAAGAASVHHLPPPAPEPAPAYAVEMELEVEETEPPSGSTEYTAPIPLTPPAQDDEPTRKPKKPKKRPISPMKLPVPPPNPPLEAPPGSGQAS